MPEPTRFLAERCALPENPDKLMPQLGKLEGLATVSVHDSTLTQGQPNGAVSIAVSALCRRRAELAGEALALDARLAQLRADLVHLDAAIRIMCPEAEPDLIRPKRPSRKGCDWFGRQELPRLILDALRDNGQPLSCDGIARAVMARKGMDAGDGTALRRIAGMVKGALRRQEGRTVEREGKGWRIHIDEP